METSVACILHTTTHTVFLTTADCSELAQQVVQRAKGRLRKRQKRRAMSLKSIAKLSCIGSESNLHFQQHTQSEAVTLQPRTTFDRRANVKTVQNTIRKHEELLRTYLAGSKRSSHRERIHHCDAQGSSNTRRHGHTSATFNDDNCNQEAKLKVIYLSERHSDTPKTTGIPNPHPATPSSSKCTQGFIHLVNTENKLGSAAV